MAINPLDPSSVIAAIGALGTGSQIPGIDTYLLPTIAVIVAISLVPLGREYLRHHRSTTVPTPTAQAPHEVVAAAVVVGAVVVGAVVVGSVAIERNIP